jgi:hypothetical protein
MEDLRRASMALEEIEVGSVRCFQANALFSKKAEVDGCPSTSVAIMQSKALLAISY